MVTPFRLAVTSCPDRAVDVAMNTSGMTCRPGRWLSYGSAESHAKSGRERYGAEGGAC
jgi:hypothetical protein